MGTSWTCCADVAEGVQPSTVFDAGLTEEPSLEHHAPKIEEAPQQRETAANELVPVKTAADVDVKSDRATFTRRAQALSIGKGVHQWDLAVASTINVRSKSYFKDKAKIPSAESLLELVNVDWFKTPPEGAIQHPARHPHCCAMDLRAHDDKRFLFVVSFIFPPFQAVYTAALDPMAPWLLEDTPQARSWKRFLAASNDEHKETFKVWFRVCEGPWFVKKVTPQNKPVLIGRRVRFETQHEQDDHMEILTDVSGSKWEEFATSLTVGSVNKMTVTCAMALEARQEDELPETLLFGCNLYKLDSTRTLCPEVADKT